MRPDIWDPEIILMYDSYNKNAQYSVVGVVTKEVSLTV